MGEPPRTCGRASSSSFAGRGSRQRAGGSICGSGGPIAELTRREVACGGGRMPVAARDRQPFFVCAKRRGRRQPAPLANNTLRRPSPVNYKRASLVPILLYPSQSHYLFHLRQIRMKAACAARYVSHRHMALYSRLSCEIEKWSSVIHVLQRTINNSRSGCF